MIWSLLIDWMHNLTVFYISMVQGDSPRMLIAHPYFYINNEFIPVMIFRIFNYVYINIINNFTRIYQDQTRFLGL